MSEHENSNIDLSVNIGGIRLKNPVIAASGTFGNGTEYGGKLDAPAIFDVSVLGGICTKGLTFMPRMGNTGTRIWETASGLLNSIGLENVGIRNFLDNDLPFLRQLGPAIIANLSGGESDEYVDGAKLLDKSSVDIIELNISCPNVKVGGMAFGLDPGTAAACVSAVRRVTRNKPLMVKLSPNAPNLKMVALSCINAGADALSLVNTFKGLAIDIVNKKLVFDGVTAGLSGPAIKPIALCMVWDLYTSLLDEGKTNIPIVGLGGIANTNDALEFLMAGASAVQVGTATFLNPHTMPEIIDGLGEYMTANKIEHISEINLRKK